MSFLIPLHQVKQGKKENQLIITGRCGCNVVHFFNNAVSFIDVRGHNSFKIGVEGVKLFKEKLEKVEDGTGDWG